MYQAPLFYTPPKEPEGFQYWPEFIDKDIEAQLLKWVKTLTLHAYQHGEYEGKRRVASYTRERGFPTELLPLIASVTEDVNLTTNIDQALVTEYSPGTQIGWHRDMPPYAEVIGLSLGSAAPFRFRKEEAGGEWRRITYTVEPRSLYLMSGPARYVWQHSIPPVEDWRYSITMRTVQT